jgi:acyl carrier protein
VEEISTLDRIVSEVSHISNIEGIGPDTKIGDINVDSLKFIELLLGFTAFFPNEVELDQLNVDAETTLRQLDAQLRGGLTMAVPEKV